MDNIKKEQFNPNIIMHTEYDLLITYDDWEIFRFQDKFYVADKYNNYIKEVELAVCEKSSKDDNQVIDFIGCDYCGQSDDLQYNLGFKLK